MAARQNWAVALTQVLLLLLLPLLPLPLLVLTLRAPLAMHGAASWAAVLGLGLWRRGRGVLPPPAAAADAALQSWWRGR